MGTISVGQTPVQVAKLNTHRVSIRFQNVGDTFIYLQRIPLQGAYSNISSSNFEVALAPLNSQTGSPEVFETRSMLAYQAIAGKCCNIKNPCKSHGKHNKEERLESDNKSETKQNCDCNCKLCLGSLAITETVKRKC